MMTCNECMNGAPYKFCCKLECGEHEFCRNCSYVSNNKYCPHKTEQMLQYSKEELNNKPADFYNNIKPIPIDWSTVKPLPQVEDGNLIPVEKVVDDMYSDSFISSKAREYYINHYATDQEKEELRMQEKMEFLFSACFLSIPFIGLIVVCLVIIFS